MDDNQSSSSDYTNNLSDQSDISLDMNQRRENGEPEYNKILRNQENSISKLKKKLNTLKNDHNSKRNKIQSDIEKSKAVQTTIQKSLERYSQALYDLKVFACHINIQRGAEAYVAWDAFKRHNLVEVENGPVQSQTYFPGQGAMFVPHYVPPQQFSQPHPPSERQHPLTWEQMDRCDREKANAISMDVISTKTGKRPSHQYKA